MRGGTIKYEKANPTFHRNKGIEHTCYCEYSSSGDQQVDCS